MKTKNRVASAVRVLLMLLLLACTALPALGDCGKERWAVKTLQDSDRNGVNMKPDRGKTISDLRKLTPPGNLKTVGNDFRFAPEYKTYTVHALLMGFKQEADEDYHIVLADLQNQKLTMVVEVPNPECANKRYSKQFAAVRAFIESIHSPSKKFYHMKNRVVVTVTGVFFFDFLHGQTGVAPNGAELHPVLKIQ